MFVFINTNKHHFPSCVLLEEYLCRAKKPKPPARGGILAMGCVWECCFCSACLHPCFCWAGGVLGAGSSTGPGFELVAADGIEH